MGPRPPRSSSWESAGTQAAIHQGLDGRDTLVHKLSKPQGMYIKLAIVQIVLFGVGRLFNKFFTAVSL